MRVVSICVLGAASASCLSQTTTGLACGYASYVGEITDHGAVELIVDGDRMYSVSETGLYVYGVSDPPSPELLGSLEMTFGLSDGVLVDDWVVGLGRRELVAINISDPSNLFIDGSLGFEHDVLQIEMAGEYAYVSSEDEPEIHVVDLSSMFFPMQVGTLLFEDVCQDMAVRDGLLSVYVAWNGLRVFDLEDASAPLQVGAIDQPGLNATLKWIGDRLYMLGSASGLQEVSLADPASPTIVNWLYEGVGVGGLYAVGERVFGSVGGMVRELDLESGEGFASVISSRYGNLQQQQTI